MPPPTSLTAAHQLLAGIAHQAPSLVQAWLDSNLAQDGRSSDGETDLTALRSAYSDAHVKNVSTPKEMADVAERLIRLLAAGCKPFESNQDGMDAFDAWAWVESLPLVQAFLKAGPPDLVALMDRKPRASHGAWSPAPPHHWAAWAMADRGDELIEMNEHGWPWPADILGWAHPQLIRDLLDRGAPWSPRVQQVWNARAKTGNLKMADVAAMTTACERKFGTITKADLCVIQNGRDLLRMIKTKGSVEDLIGAVRQHADLGAWTVLADGAEWPVLSRLLITSVNNSLPRSQRRKLNQLITDEFERLAGDPDRPFSPGGPRLGTVLQVLGEGWAKAPDSYDPPNWQALAPRVTAWAGPADLPTMLTCAHDLRQPAALDRQRLDQVTGAVNGRLFRLACEQLAKGQEDDPWVALAVERVQSPDGGLGFWDPSTLASLADKPLSYGGAPAYPSLVQHLSSSQRLISLGAYLAHQPWINRDIWDAVVEHLDRLTTTDQRQRLLDVLAPLKAEAPQLDLIRGKLEAMIRADRAADWTPHTARRIRPRA